MPEKFPEHAYAEWCLLLTKARDKSYRPHFSDREIRHAVDFFRAEGDAHRLADACYTAGRVNTDLNRPDVAARFYLEAESAAVPTGDYSLLYLIAAQRGTLYAHQDLVSEAAESYQKALHYAEASGDSAYLAEAYQHIGRIYGMKRDWVKADSCCRLAVDICREIGDWDGLCGTLNEQAGYAIYARNFDLAEDCYQAIETIPDEYIEKNKYQLYLGKGDMYRLRGDYKQAVSYLEKAAQSNNIYTKNASYLALYCLYKDQKALDKIIQYSDLYIDSQLSVFDSEKQKAIMALQSQYNHEQSQNQIKELAWEKKQTVYISLCIALFSLLVFVLAFFFYRSRMQKRKRELEEAKRIVHNLKAEQFKNEKRIEEKEQQLARQSSEYSEEKASMQKEVNQYKTINAQLEKHIAHLECQIKAGKTKLNLNELESILSSQMLLYQLVENPRPIKDEEWPVLIALTNVLFDRFAHQLKARYPQLRGQDVCNLCLLKLGFSTQDIATIICVEVPSVRQWKTRVKAKLGLEQADSVNEFVAAFCPYQGRKRRKNP